MTFYAVELDTCPAYGWTVAPFANVRINALRNGHERRNREGDLFKHSFTLPLINKKQTEYLEELKSAFLAMGGPTDSFLTKDYSDYLALQEPLGTAPSGSTPVQLTKTYDFQGVAFYERPITKPLSAGFVMYRNGVPKAGTLDTLTGLFTPTTAWGGGTLSWSGEFRVPVRFAEFSLSSTADNQHRGELVISGTCALVEVFGE